MTTECRFSRDDVETSPVVVVGVWLSMAMWWIGRPMSVGGGGVICEWVLSWTSAAWYNCCLSCVWFYLIRGNQESVLRPGHYPRTSSTTYVCMYVCVYVRMYVRMYVCMYVCMHVCMCVCVCLNSLTYTHMYISLSLCDSVSVSVSLSLSLFLSLSLSLSLSNFRLKYSIKNHQ